MNNTLLTLLTSEDKAEIRTAIKQIIIKQVEIDIENSCDYLIDAREVEEMVEEIIGEIKDEVKDMYKEKMIKAFEKKLENI